MWRNHSAVCLCSHTVVLPLTEQVGCSKTVSRPTHDRYVEARLDLSWKATVDHSLAKKKERREDEKTIKK